jgi:NAD+ kinase
MSFNPIALIGRFADTRVAECMRTLVQRLLARKIETLVDRAIVAEWGGVEGIVAISRGEIARRARLVIAIGGDGTLLYAARLVASEGIPLVGVNRGRLGFLTDVSPEDMLDRLDDILSGHFSEDHRTMLEARIERADGTTVASSPGLNDVVIHKRETGRILDFETWIEGRYLNTHRADGLVVASATGSTAYALSCGGPIVHPDLGVLVLAPICPHTLSDRPVVVPSGVSIEVRLAEHADARAEVACDGIGLAELDADAHLEIVPSKHRVTLLHPPGYDYYRLLRSKLHWGRGPFDGPPKGPLRPPER